MMTCKADNRSRVKLPDVKPGTVFELSVNGSGHFNLVEVQPKVAAVVEPVKRKDGSYKWPVKLTDEEFNSMMRAAKESR